MKVTTIASIIIMLSNAQQVFAQAKDDMPTQIPSTSAIKQPTQGIRLKGNGLNPLIKDPASIAYILANIKSKHYALKETPQGVKELEAYNLVKRADDLMRVDRVDEAEYAYKKVITENGDSAVTAGAILGLAEVAQRSGDKSGALSLYSHIIDRREGRTWVSSRSNSSVTFCL